MNKKVRHFLKVCNIFAGIKEEGIFKVAGDPKTEAQLVDIYEKGSSPDYSKIKDVHTVASMLKKFFRELTDMPFAIIGKLSKSEPLATIVTNFQKETNSWDEVRWQTIGRVFGLLRTISLNVSKTKMVTSTLDYSENFLGCWTVGC